MKKYCGISIGNWCKEILANYCCQTISKYKREIKIKTLYKFIYAEI